LFAEPDAIHNQHDDGQHRQAENHGRGQALGHGGQATRAAATALDQKRQGFLHEQTDDHGNQLRDDRCRNGIHAVRQTLERQTIDQQTAAVTDAQHQATTGAVVAITPRGIDDRQNGMKEHLQAEPFVKGQWFDFTHQGGILIVRAFEAILFGVTGKATVVEAWGDFSKADKVGFTFHGNDLGILATDPQKVAHRNQAANEKRGQVGRNVENCSTNTAITHTHKWTSQFKTHKRMSCTHTNAHTQPS
jgi:hypothetical protein